MRRRPRSTLDDSPHAPTLHLRTLGRFGVACGAHEAGSNLTQKARALLVHLTFHPKVDHPRENLVALFWPDLEAGAPRASLSTALSSIRRLLRDLKCEPDAYLQANTSIVRWVGPVILDTHEFETLARSTTRRDLECAQQLYEGDFLEGDFDEWTVGWRERFSHSYENALEKLLELQPDPKYAKALLSRNPYNEAAYSILLEDAIAHKRPHLAHAIFVRATKALDELGGDASAAFKHRYNHLSREVVEPLHSLPPPTTRLIGRETELDEALALLSSHRLVTIAGPGGIGKTRLALEIARNSADAFAGGACVVELEDCALPEMILSRVAGALGIRASSAYAVFDDVVAACKGQASLLLLDNCEHLIVECARVVTRLLREIPGLTILATSREPLHVDGEYVLRARPLSQPSGMALFSERALAADRSFLPFGAMTTIAAIVQHLDGLPLAIEFAAARVDVMSPEQILLGLMKHLDTLGTGKRTAAHRHRTLPALIDWSYDLLDENERAAFRRLGVFVGRFSIEAAEAACGFEPLAPEDVMPLLVSLTRKSLVQTEAPAGATHYYYRLLQTVRSYAQDCIVSAGERDELAARATRYYLNFSKRIREQLNGEGLEDALARVTAEWENVHATLQCLFDRADAKEGREMVRALGPAWLHSGNWIEGQFWIDQIVTDTSTEPAEQAVLLNIAAVMAQSQGDYVRLKDLAERLTELSKALGDRLGIGKGENMIAIAMQNRGDFEEAERFYKSAVENYRAIEHSTGIAVALMNLGTLIAEWRRDLPQARLLLEEALVELRKLGVSVNLAHALSNLSTMLVHEGKPREALVPAQESLELYERLGNDAYAALQLIAIAGCYEAQALHEMAIDTLRGAFKKMVGRSHPKFVAAYVERVFEILIDIGEFEAAARVIGFADANRRQREIPRPETADTHLGTALGRLASHYARKDLAVLRLEGELLTLDQISAILEAAWRHVAPP